MAGEPILGLQNFSPVEQDPFTTAIKAYMGMKQARGESLENKIRQMKIANPALLAGGEAAQIYGLSKQDFGLGQQGTQDQRQAQAISQAVGGGNGAQGGYQLPPGARLPENVEQPRRQGFTVQPDEAQISLPPIKGMSSENAISQQLRGENQPQPMQNSPQNANGMNLGQKLAKNKLDWLSMSPVQQQAAIAEAQSMATIPAQVELQRQLAGVETGKSGAITQQTQDIGLAKTIRETAQNMTFSSDQALRTLELFDKEYKKASPVLRGKGLGETVPGLLSKHVENANYYGGQLALQMAPILKSSGVVTDATLDTIKDIKLNSRMSAPAQEQQAQEFRNYLARMRESDNFTDYALEKGVDPQRVGTLWNRYNMTYPMDPTMIDVGGNEFKQSNLGKFKTFIDDELAGRPQPVNKPQSTKGPTQQQTQFANDTNKLIDDEIARRKARGEWYE